MAKKKEITTNAMRILKSAKIEYEPIEYEFEGEIGDNFGIEISKRMGIDASQIFKTLVLKGDKSGIIVCCIPACCEVDLKKVAQISGNKKTEMIHVKELLGLTGYIRGSVSPVGMKKAYPTFIDNSCLNFEKIIISAGICGLSLSITPQNVMEITNATVEDIIKK